MPPLPNNTILLQFRLLRTLGQGGFGITYEAIDTQLQSRVVIKEHLPTSCAFRWRDHKVYPKRGFERDYRDTLQHAGMEVAILKGLNHPHIVRVLQDFSVLNTYYYVMPFIEAAQELGKSAPRPEEITEAWLRPILFALLDALGYLHGKGLVHRDVKPTNILLQNGTKPILIDFGAAKVARNPHTAYLIEAQGYTPIEQLQIDGQLGPWTDLYALGASCYKLMVGQTPPRSTVRAQNPDSYIPLKNFPNLAERFSQAFIDSVEKALNMNPRDRWQSAGEWKQQLVGVPLPHGESVPIPLQEQEQVPEPGIVPPPPAPPAAKPPNKTRRIVFLCLFMYVLGFISAIIAMHDLGLLNINL